MKKIQKIIILLLLIQSYVFANNCESPGLPSKKLYFGNSITQNININQREYWYCIDNPYDGFSIFIDAKNTKKEFIYRDILDSNLNEISEEEGQAGRYYSASAYGGEPKYDRNLEKGRYYLKLKIKNRYKNSSINIHLYRNDRGIIRKIPFKTK